jgi:26S proteasome regulatory subunit T4
VSWVRWFVLNPQKLAGMMAIRDEREYVIQEDFMKAVRKMMEQKKLETKLDYQKP